MNQEMTPEAQQQVEQAVSKSLMQLMRNSNNAFIVNVLLNMKRELSTEVEAMEVHGTTLKINPEFFMSRNDNDRKFDLVHSAWHVGFFDYPRGQGKEETEIWNMACDLYNNAMLRNDSAFDIKLPQDAAYDSKFNSWEKDDIYEHLLKNQQDQPKDDPMGGDLGGAGNEDGEGDGDGDSGQQPSPEQMEALQNEMSNIVQQSAMQSKMAGAGVPPQIEQYLEDLYNPKLPWSHLLMKYFNHYAADDYSYQKVNKKYFPHGLILPTLFSEGLGKIAIANDESCSVSDEDFKMYLGAIEHINKEYNPEEMEIISFTTQVNSKFIVKQDDDINKIKFRAHGGTDLRPVFDYFENNRPQVLIVFSDLECSPIKHDPGYDVIWICVGNPRAQVNFGKLIHVDSN